MKHTQKHLPYMEKIYSCELMSPKYLTICMLIAFPIFTYFPANTQEKQLYVSIITRQQNAGRISIHFENNSYVLPIISYD